MKRLFWVPGVCAFGCGGRSVHAHTTPEIPSQEATAQPRQIDPLPEDMHERDAATNICVADPESVQLDAPREDVAGDISRESIRARVSELRPALSDCFGQAQQLSNVTTRRRVVVGVVVNRDGSVACASVRESEFEDDDALRACVAHAFHRLRLDPSPELIVLYYPLEAVPASAEVAAHKPHDDRARARAYAAELYDTVCTDEVVAEAR